MFGKPLLVSYLFSSIKSKSIREKLSRASRGDAPSGNAALSIATARISKLLNKYLVSDKQLLRLHYNAQRRNMTLTDVHHKSQIIIDKLISLPEFLHSDVCLLYMPIHHEVDVTSLLQSGKKIVLPVVREGNLQLYSITSESDLQQGAYGILEPREDCPLISPSEIQLAIIPALAFDVQGYRLGYGKGYYDKLLPQITARKIGVAYEFQIMEQVQFPRETHDRPVEMIITEEQVRVCHD